MGREIRRVPPNWEHPRITRGNRLGEYHPMYDDDYASAAEKWLAECIAWSRGEHPDQSESNAARGISYFWDWSGNPPDEEYYRSERWAPDDATWFQVYETVSEGTPVTPPFATKAELIDYLVTHGDFWDQRRAKERTYEYPDGPGWTRENAESFVADEWAPSFMVSNTAAGVMVKAPRDGKP